MFIWFGREAHKIGSHAYLFFIMKRSTNTFRIFQTAAAMTGAVATLGLLGCQDHDAPAEGGQPQAAAMPVTVMTVESSSVTLTKELPGRTSPYRIAEVRARVNGIVEARLFEEGTDVEAGQSLFKIDPAPYAAQVDAAKATLAQMEASYSAAKAQADRFEGLIESNAVSKQNYDDVVSTAKSLKAQIAAAKAALTTAEINLGYTDVTSPIDGRIGRADVTEGAYVQAGTATLMSTVQQLDPLYVDLSESAEEVLKLKADLASGKLKKASDGNAKVEIILPSGAVYGEPGSLQFSDITVNPATGTVTLRAIVPNPNGDLLPGMFVRARLEEGTNPDAMLIPNSLVSRNSKGEATVMIVGADNKVESRVIETSRSVGNRWLVTAGIEPGDQIITNNLQKIRPGVAVAPSAAQPE